MIGGGIGSLLGATAAYKGGITDFLLLRFVEVVQSFPVLLFALALFAAIVAMTFGYMIGGAVLVEVVFSWPGIGTYAR